VVRYLTGIPRKPLPVGRVVVHNHVRPEGFHARYPLGLNGFRAWTDDLDPDHHEPCSCVWAEGRLEQHYQVCEAWSRRRRAELLAARSEAG
jgi:hypothetical protein